MERVSQESTHPGQRTHQLWQLVLCACCILDVWVGYEGVACLGAWDFCVSGGKYNAEVK